MLLTWPVQAPGASRDVHLLDIALDGYFRLCIERTDKAALSGDDLCEMTGLVLRNAVIALDSEDLVQVWARMGPLGTPATTLPCTLGADARRATSQLHGWF